MKNSIADLIRDPQKIPAKNYNDLVRSSLKWITNSPGFFKTYTGGTDFFLTLTNPITRPVIGSFLTALFAILAALASAIVLGCLLVYAGALVFKNNKVSARCYDLITNSVTAALLLWLATIIAAVKTVQAVITDPVKLLTRSTSTIISSLINVSKEIEQITEDQAQAKLKPATLNTLDIN